MYIMYVIVYMIRIGLNTFWIKQIISNQSYTSLLFL